MPEYNEPTAEVDEMSVENARQLMHDADWIKTAQDAYRSSTDYWDSSLKRQVEKNIRMFQSKHASGSKYHTDGFKYRSKIFNPKTRATIQRNEAEAAESLFSTQDVVRVSPQNELNEAQRVYAEVQGELVNYRLENSIPWFQTCMGAFQDAMVSGVCVTKQYWDYEEREGDVQYQQVLEEDEDGNVIGKYDEDGDPVIEEFRNPEVISDQPVVDLWPLENVRFDPAADWRDPVNTSPYWITLIPMFLGDLKERIKQDSSKTGTHKWRPLTDEELMTGDKNRTQESIRTTRAGRQRQDPTLSIGRQGDFQIVWVHENIIKKAGTDWIYYTIGTNLMLSVEVTPLKEVYVHDMRPYVMGNTVIEAHRTTPSGGPEIWEGMQTAINDLTNQRFDNVRQVLNARYFIKNNANVDTRLLKYSIPGSIVSMDDPNGDVKHDRPPDVTGSSYNEQNHFNVGFDEVSGSFSPGSVQTNRNLNETVGGMNLLTTDADKITTYRLRIFVETWVEPVLKQLVALERAYETDETIIAIAGQKADIYDQLEVDRVPEEVFTMPINIRVEVGYGNLNPQQRVEKLMFAMNSVGAAGQIPGVNAEEVEKEVFSALGYRDASRFFAREEGQDPEKAEMMTMIEDLQNQLQGKQLEAQAKMDVEELKSQTAIARDRINNEVKMQIESAKQQIAQIDRQLKAAEMKGKNTIETGKLLNQRQALIFQMQQKYDDMLTQNTQDRMSQTLLNDEYGMIPGQVG